MQDKPPRVTHSLPAADAREVFALAEVYLYASGVLIEHENDSEELMALNMVSPSFALRAFAAELLLKSMLCDCGHATIPGIHNLLTIFKQLPTNLRGQFQKSWSGAVQAVLGDAAAKFKPESDNIESALGRYAQLFEKLRYWYQHKEVGFAAVLLPILIGVFRRYLLEKHPDWDDGGKHHFATFHTR